MARFVLVPCRIREDKVVADGDPLELDWPKAAALLAPSQTFEALSTLRRMRVNAYVGLVKKEPPPGSSKQTIEQAKNAPPTNFLFVNGNPNSASIGWLLKKNPELITQVKALYRVDVAIFDAKIEEHSSGEPA